MWKELGVSVSFADTVALPCGKEAPLCDAAKHGLCEVARAGDRNVLALSHAGWS